jgi:hAT family C-terminal dimerisation region
MRLFGNPALTCYCELTKYACLHVQQETHDEAGEELHCLDFWHNKRKELPMQFKLAMKVHSAPGTSAPIEVVFRHGTWNFSETTSSAFGRQNVVDSVVSEEQPVT